MRYSVYQIKLDALDVSRINAMSDPYLDPKFKAYRDAMAEDFAAAKGHYQHVADIDATDLEHVFHIGNVGPEEKIDRIGPMHSISVGDVVVAASGEQYGVAGYGFTDLENMV